MTSPGGVQSGPSRRQKRMGPAPFASFEDLSDEVRSHVDSPEEKIDGGSVVRLPGIREDVTPGTPASQGRVSPEFIYSGISLVGAQTSPPSAAMSSVSTPQSSTKASLQTPSTPRIDISRASSSSHHDSRDSSPERELFEGHDPARAKLGLGFREEGTLDLRSSTEELDFQDSQSKLKSKPQTPGPQEDYTPSHHRKDSQSSEICMLSISGRTSRLSSIGSQGSTHSRISNASHLSVISGQSGLSRSPSPHKMLLETSFCGTKQEEADRKAANKHGTKSDPEDLEKLLLSRKHDPTKAILAEGTVMHTPKITKGGTPPEKPARKEIQTVKSSITITVDKPSVTTSSSDKPKLPRTIIASSGIEYTYIPLKGPLPEDPAGTEPAPKVKVRESRSAPSSKKSTTQSKSKQSKTPSKSQSRNKERAQSAIVQVKPEDEPKYIWIKLKPDHLYDDRDKTSSEVQKPDSLSLNNTHLPAIQTDIEVVETSSDKTYSIKPVEPHGRSISSTPSASPKLSRHVLKEPFGSSKSPSPSLSRKSSFASLFKNKDAVISPESPTIPGMRRKSTLSGIIKDAGENLRERRRSRSKSRERDRSSLSVAPSSTESIDSKGKQKASVFSIFKGKSKPAEKTKNDSDDGIGIGSLSNVEFKFRPERCEMRKYHETPLEGDSVRIPLHSPTYYEQKTFLQELRSSSQGSQETVIEANITKEEPPPDDKVEPIPSAEPGPVQKTKIEEIRQNSTSSENLVFTTRLGSNNQIFTTKLPKEKQSEKELETIETTSLDKAIVERSPIDNQTHVKIDHLPRSVSIDSKRTEDIVKSESAQSMQEKVSQKGAKKRPTKIANDDDHCSSESEKDSEIDFLKEKQRLELQLDTKVDVVEIERTGLVLLQDSFDDELPYIPTTLPQERSVAIPIVPIKQRNTFEMKVCPIERPRSTTPINPSCLEDYCEEMVSAINAETVAKTVEKLKISLPREDSIKSPRRPGTNTNWFEFAEKKIVPGRRTSLPQETETTPPPLPPKGIHKEWINFEEIPEKRKPPKRIQTIPSRGQIEVPESVLHDNVVYSYVNPEDCKCECHEINARARSKERKDLPEPEPVVQEDELPLLQDETVEEEKPVHETVERIKLDVTILDRRSVISDSSIDLSTSVEHTVEANGVDCLHTPFTSDLGVSSNRSSIVSQDEAQTPDESPNAFPKLS